MNKPHYFQRYDHAFYSPRNEARPEPEVTVWSRERQLTRVAQQVQEAWQFGDWLYNSVLAKLPRHVAFGGTAASLNRLTKDGYVERPVRAWPQRDVHQAALIYSAHNAEAFNDWSLSARAIGIAAYCNWLNRQGCQPMHRRGPSALEREAARLNKPKRVKR